MSIFSSIAGRKPRSSNFDLSHERKLSARLGFLTPILFEDIVPGDKFKVNSEIMMRFAPMLAPIMHRVNVYTHYFFVPNRLLWNEWEDFITGGPDGTLAPSFPTLNMTEANRAYFAKKRVSDYLGLPVCPSDKTITNPLAVSALPFRAYTRIFNEYYRDQNVEGEVPFSLGSGDAQADIAQITQLRKRSWEKDYFTSCLPWAQRGTEVQLPIDSEFSPNYQTTEAVGTGDVNGAMTVAGGVVNANGIPVELQNLQDPQAIDSQSVTINELRKAVRLQEWLEKNARGGARYIEQILSHFGVVSSDSRLQRAEYLAGGKNPVVISEVLSTFATSEDNPEGFPPQGNMAGHGVSVGSTHGFNKRFEEHGQVIGIMSVLPRTTYQQGIHRNWRKFDKFDHYFPEFAHLGEQDVKQSEVYVKWDGTSEDATKTFGYQSRYAEHKFRESSVHGDFRDNLNYWHMGRIFDEEPSLNGSFVRYNLDKRIFAVQSSNEDELYCQIYNRVKARRPMPYHGTPTL